MTISSIVWVSAYILIIIINPKPSFSRACVNKLYGAMCEDSSTTTVYYYKVHIYFDYNYYVTRTLRCSIHHFFFGDLDALVPGGFLQFGKVL